MKTTKIIDGFYRVSNQNDSVAIKKRYSFWILEHNTVKGMFKTKKEAVNAAQNFLNNN